MGFRALGFRVSAAMVHRLNAKEQRGNPGRGCALEGWIGIGTGWPLAYRGVSGLGFRV